jgi:hypothetical protein
MTLLNISRGCGNRTRRRTLPALQKSPMSDRPYQSLTGNGLGKLKFMQIIYHGYLMIYSIG